MSYEYIEIARDGHVASVTLNRPERLNALGCALMLELIDAATLLEWGFYDEVVPPDELLARARERADEYAAKPPIAAQMIKQSVNAVVSALDRSTMHMDLDQWMLTASTDDYREGIEAFFEKRPPRFKGN